MRYIWNFIAFSVSIVYMEHKKPNLPLPSGGQIFLQPFEDRLHKRREKSDIFRKNERNIHLLVLVGKIILCRSQKSHLF